MKIYGATFFGKQQSLFKLTNHKPKTVGLQVSTGGKAFLNAKYSHISSIFGFTLVADLAQQTVTIAVDLGGKHACNPFVISNQLLDYMNN